MQGAEEFFLPNDGRDEMRGSGETASPVWREGGRLSANLAHQTACLIRFGLAEEAEEIICGQLATTGGLPPKLESRYLVACGMGLSMD